MNLPTSTISVEGVVEIPQSGLYATSPEALKRLLKHLRKLGYQIDNCVKEARKSHKPEPSLRGVRWFAALEIDHARCTLCKKEIKRAGCHGEGRRCEYCGEVIYARLVDGAKIEFTFDKLERRGLLPETITMKVKSWDKKKSDLVLYPEPQQPRSSFKINVAAAKKILAEALAQKQCVLEDGFIHIRYDANGLVDVINTFDVSRGDKKGEGEFIHNVEQYKVWDGKEYAIFDHPPVGETYCIFESWHWAPLPKSPTLHEDIFHAASQVSRVDFYYQDGRPAFDAHVLLRMRIFVKHFTTLDLKSWDKMVRTADLSGPGFIRAVANFVAGKKAIIRNEPNIGNALIMASKIAGGHALTSEELGAGMLALSDDKICNTMFDMVTGAPLSRWTKR